MDTLTRKEELQGMIDSRTNQIAEGVSLATQGVIESEINAFKAEISQIEEAEQNEAAQKVVIQKQEEKREGYTLPTDLNAFFSNGSYLNADGEPYLVTNANRVALQIVKDALSGNDNEHNARYAELESKYNTDTTNLRNERDAFKTQSEDKDQIIESLRQQLSQTVIERDDAFAKRDAAVEEKKQREAQESADLAKLIADENTEKERKAAEDRAKRTVYDVKPDDELFPRNYTAKLASTGETVTFSWTTKNYYTELTDPNEVEQFRQQHAEQNAVPNLTLDPADQIKPIAEVTAPESFPTEGEIQTVPAPVASGVSSEDGKDGETVSRQEFEALKATVNDLCRVCDIAEVA